MKIEDLAKKLAAKGAEEIEKFVTIVLDKALEYWNDEVSNELAEAMTTQDEEGGMIVHGYTHAFRQWNILKNMKISLLERAADNRKQDTLDTE